LEAADIRGNKVVAMATILVTSGNSFKLLFGLIDIEQKRKMSMTRQERERAVLDLYNQGKNIREIAQEVRMSFRDIGTILNKADEWRVKNNNNNNDIENKKRQQEQEQQEQLSLSTQAYKLFSEGKSPIQVAVALNQKESEITRFYKEYIKLSHMHDLNIVYEEVKGDIIPFLKLYRSARSAGMNEEHVVNLLRIANDNNVNNNTNNNLPAVEHRYNKLKQEVNALEFVKLNSNRDLQDLRKRILNSRKLLDSCDLTYKQQAEKIAGLQAKRIELDDLVKRFENNNEEYLKINQTVKDKVGSILSDGKVLLRLALYSVMESIRNEPIKYSPLIYYYNNNNNISLRGTTHYPASSMYGGQQQQLYISPRDYFTEHYTATLLNEAEKFYNKLVKEITEGITYDPAFSSSTSPSSSSPLLSSSSSDGTTTKFSSAPAKSTGRY
jgi:transposase